MAINSFRGDAEPRSKVVRLLKPNNTVGVTPSVRINNKVLQFEDWNATTIAAAINDSELAELEALTATVTGEGHIEIVGEVDDDFEVTVSQVPTVTVSNVVGENPRAQVTLIQFNGATSGTYTITLNNQTTAAINFGDIADARTKLDALASFASSDFDLVQEGADYRLTFKGAYLTANVIVSVNGANLRKSVGAVVVTQVAQAVPARYDVYTLGVVGSSSTVVTLDGKSDRIYSDDSLAQVQAKLQAMTSSGRSVRVYGGQKESVAIPFRPSFYIVEFDGYSTATRPAFSCGAGGEILSFYDPTSGCSSNLLDQSSAAMTGKRVELILFDFSEDRTSMDIVVDGQKVQITATDTSAAIIAKLNDKSRYYEWGAVTSFGTFSGAFASPSMPSACQVIWWQRSDLFNNVPVPESYIYKEGGGGVFRRLVRGGTVISGSVCEIYRTPGSISGGTWDAKLVEGTASGLAWNITAANLQTALAAVLSGTTCTRGTGEASAPWVVTLPTTSTDPNQKPTATTAFTEAGSAGAATMQTATAGRSARAIVAVSTRAAGGAYLMRFGSEGPVSFTPGLSAGAFKTLLEQFRTLNNTADTTVTVDAPSGRYSIDFGGALANKTVPAFRILPEEIALTAAADDTGVEVVELASGPGCFGDPKNWTMGRLPQHGDDVVMDAAGTDVVYGLRHHVAFTANATTDQLAAVGGHDFLANQRVRVYTVAGTLPGGLLGGTDYFVLSPDYTRGTFQLATTQNGAPINITTAGSGDLWVGVQVKTLRILSTFTAKLGREENFATGFREYRPRYLCLGAYESVDIGEGNGSGSSLLRLNFGNSIPTVRVNSTGTPSESGYPAVNILAQSELLRFANMDGSAGVAAGDDETAIIGDVGLHGGDTVFGTVTVRRDFLRNGGACTSRELAVQGVIREN